MSRLAILVNSPGVAPNALQGPPHDVANLREYLRSPTGGSWNANEIRTLNSPTLASLYKAFRWDHSLRIGLYDRMPGSASRGQVCWEAWTVKHTGVGTTRLFGRFGYIA